jgi:hypothetical protein
MAKLTLKCQLLGLGIAFDVRPDMSLIDVHPCMDVPMLSNLLHDGTSPNDSPLQRARCFILGSKSFGTVCKSFTAGFICCRGMIKKSFFSSTSQWTMTLYLKFSTKGV